MATAIVIKQLCPTDGRKSFYGKARILQTEEGYKFLKSYNTVVCGYVNGSLQRYWDGYSATTMRHINSFLDAVGMSAMCKADWTSLPVVKNQTVEGL